VTISQRLKTRLALMTIMLAIIGGYSRRAYAQCVSGAPGNYSYGGTITTTQNISGRRWWL
jgi:hypothetical protein